MTLQDVAEFLKLAERTVYGYAQKGLLPGIKINTSPTDHRPIEQMQLQRFDGKRWVRFGSIFEGSAV